MQDDDRLSTYRDKRDLASSPEPNGGGSNDERPLFVIQEHDASTHHFDLRLEIDGVLKSWSVPKGPATDPSDKRLAIPTEDHPLEYADFEGVIPEDEYGGGTVLLWDRGPYRNLRAEKDDDGATRTPRTVPVDRPTTRRRQRASAEKVHLGSRPHAARGESRVPARQRPLHNEDTGVGVLRRPRS